jgi:uncharacterized RDD family membrane protein YckC
MSTIRIATNFNIDLEFPAAPFHRRFLAWVCDMVVLVFYIYLIAKVFESYMRNASYSDNYYIARSLFLFFLFVPLFTYHLICETLMNGQSIGKKITGIRVVNENGSKPSIGQFVIRWLIRTSDFLLLITMAFASMAANDDIEFYKRFFVGFALLITDIILVNASKKRQRLGDMLAHTILIRTRQEGDIHETIFQEVDEKYVPSFPQVMQLSDRDINALKGIIDTARRRDDYAMAELASNKIKAHLNISSTLSAFDFLEVLMKDYNYLSSN